MPSTVRWRGDAPAVAQVDTYVVTTYDVTTTWKITINSKTISTVGTGGTAATTATALLALLQASTVPQEFKEITWSVNSATITATAVTAGKPFTIVQTVSGGTGSWVHTAVTVNSGPNDASVGANYSTGAMFATGDTLVFDSGSSDVLWGLDQHTITPAAVQVLPGYTGKIGLRLVNSDSISATYYEYRPTYFMLGQSSDATNILVTIQGGGSRVKFDFGTSQATSNVYAKQNRDDSNVPQVLFKSTHASTALNVNKGDVGVAFFGGETSTILTLNVGYATDQTGDSAIWLGSGVTLTNTTIVQNGGILTVNSPVTGTGTQTQYAGTSYFGILSGTGGLTGLTLLGGTCVYSTTGTLAVVKVGGTGALDFGQDMRAKTVTGTLEIYGTKCSINDPNGLVNSGLMAVGFNESADADQVNWGVNFRLVRGVTP